MSLSFSEGLAPRPASSLPVLPGAPGASTAGKHECCGQESAYPRGLCAAFALSTTRRCGSGGSSVTKNRCENGYGMNRCRDINIETVQVFFSFKDSAVLAVPRHVLYTRGNGGQWEGGGVATDSTHGYVPALFLSVIDVGWTLRHWPCCSTTTRAMHAGDGERTYTGDGVSHAISTDCATLVE